MLRAPIWYIGGKSRIRNEIIKLMPKHRVYVEPFFGAGWVFFGKSHSEVEIINDKDEEVVNFYRVLKDDEKYRKLKRLLDLTLWSESEYNRAWELFENKGWKDDVERAWSFYVRARFSMGGRVTKKEFGFGWFEAISKTKHWSLLEQYGDIHERLKYVTILCDDALRVLKKVPDSEDVLVYVDPPYVLNVRTCDDDYTFEMGNEEHERLLDVLMGFKKTKIILSGYENRIYERLNENGWFMKKIETVAHSVGLKRKSDDEELSRPKRVEVIWWNYRIGLF